MQACPDGIWRPGKICIHCNIDTPFRFAAGPDTARQSDARDKGNLTGYRLKLRDINCRKMPAVNAAQKVSLSVNKPYCAHIPPGSFANCLYNLRCNLFKCSRFSQPPDYRILNSEAALRLLPLHDQTYLSCYRRDKFN